MSYNQTRRIDPQGRIMIPSHIRKELNLEPGCLVSVELGNDRTIKIKVAQARCAICGKTILGKSEFKICSECAKSIANAEKQRGGDHGND